MSAFSAVWTGRSFEPLNRFHNVLNAAFGQGEIVTLEQVHERSKASHDHEFAWLDDVHATLPDSIAANYPSAEHLRKSALIATGWCHVRDYPCSSRAEAQRWAANLRAEADTYAVVIVRDDVVRVCTAKSQARNKMKAADFQASKVAIIDYIASLLGVAPRTANPGEGGMSLSAESRQFLKYVASQDKGRVPYTLIERERAYAIAKECLAAGYIRHRRMSYAEGYQITEAGKAFLGGEQL